MNPFDLHTLDQSSWAFLNAIGQTPNAFSPQSDNNQTIGSASLRWATLFTPIIDSGTTGSIFLKTNSGRTDLEIADPGVATANWLQIFGQGSGSNATLIRASGSDTNVGIYYDAKGNESHYFRTGGGVSVQARIIHTASATNGITLTGSNGGNPILNTTAGGLDLSSATIRFPNIGTTANAANATLNAVGSNDLLRSTSSLRYKTEVAELPLKSAQHIVFSARPITFRAKEGGKEHIGLAAEWMHEIDERTVTLDEEKRPDWVQYPHLTAPIMLVIQDQEHQLRALTARIAKLEKPSVP